jgi:hypothetical protein
LETTSQEPVLIRESLGNPYPMVDGSSNGLSHFDTVDEPSQPQEPHVMADWSQPQSKVSLFRQQQYE